MCHFSGLDQTTVRWHEVTQQMAFIFVSSLKMAWCFMANRGHSILFCTVKYRNFIVLLAFDIYKDVEKQIEWLTFLNCGGRINVLAIARAHLWVLFTNKWTLAWVYSSLHLTIQMKREMSHKALLVIYQLILFLPSLMGLSFDP